jgi:two-component system, OmpR family, phosphate regulon sensor histidine kinase PhoR
MTAEPGGKTDFRSVMLGRLVTYRFPLAASVFVFALLYVGQLLPAGIAAICMAAMVVVCIFAPMRTAKARQAAQEHVPGGSASARTEAVVDSLPDPVIVLDARGTIRTVNKAARRMFGDTVQPGASAMIRFRNPELLTMINEAMRGGSPRPVEVLERYPIERWFEASIKRLPLEEAGDAPFLLHFRDLSEMRRIDRMRSDFIANASHELRTPLASLSGFIDTLRGPARNDEAARDRFLAIMQEQSERMSRLIDDLLSLSRLETAFGRTDFDPVDIVDVLRHVTVALAPAAEELSVKLIEDYSGIDSTDCRVWGSRDELIQVFTNLVENAIRYGAIGEKIEIRAGRKLVSGIDSIVVTVRDYGPGIPEEHIPRVTERFYRVDVDSSRARKGTGLGLAIVKHILTRHLGRLSISSVTGEGATFAVTIPVWNDDKAPVAKN